MTNILLLGSQHGNELLGDLLIERIHSQHPQLLPYITFEIANPRAYEAGVRYIESDMNRSYNVNTLTYESQQAERIEMLIDNNNFDIILDLHTTVCDVPPCIIIEDIYDENTAFLRACSIDKILLMQCDLMKHSLIGRNKKTVAIEVANKDITPELLDQLCQDLQDYIDTKQPHAQKSVYLIKELLLKTSIAPEEASKLVNFEVCKQGFIPILVGENSYKKNTEYLGFKADKETIITL